MRQGHYIIFTIKLIFVWLTVKKNQQQKQLSEIEVILIWKCELLWAQKDPKSIHMLS